MAYLLPFLQDFSFPTSIAIGALSLFFLFFSVLLRRLFDRRKMGSAVPAVLPTVPEVPGLPIIGNLLQLKEKKPHRTFLEWAEEYGPIYSIKTGASTIIVLNSPDVAKEAMVTRFSSISTRKLSNALKILTCDKSMVAMSDYDEFHKTVKRHILNNLLGPNAQKRHRSHRDAMMDNMLEQLHVLAKGDPAKAVNFRHIFESALFRMSLRQVLGADVESVYVEELGSLLSRKEIHKILVLDMMEGAIDVDWRDFFPYLKWVPNKKFENNIRQKHLRRLAVMNALIKQQRKRIDSGEGVNCYLDYMLSEAQNLSNEQIAILVWEAIIETADTTLVTTEWAMYQLAKDPIRQDRLYREIQDVCGSNKMTEEQFYRLPYLNAVFHETIRKHSPAPLVPLRYVHEDTQIGGYHVPAGSEIAVNIWGCNMNKNDWQNPEEWSPERFLEGKYEPQDLHKTMAFGAGKRVCAGALQAMLVACSSIGRFVQEFEWRLMGSEEENVDTLGLTSQKLYPLHVAIKLRN